MVWEIIGKSTHKNFSIETWFIACGSSEQCLLQAPFQRLKRDGLHFSATFPTLSFISFNCFLVKTSDTILSKVSVFSLIWSWSRSWKETREMAAEIHSKSERLLGTDANKSGRVRRVQSADRTKVCIVRDLQRLSIFCSPPAMDKDIFHYIRLLKAPSNLVLNIFN